MAADLNLLHPELRPTWKFFPRFNFNRWNLWLIRWLSRFALKQIIPDSIQVEQVDIPSLDPETKIRLRIYKPRLMVTPAPVLVWIHGGGLISGNVEMDDAWLSDLVQKLGIVAVSVDYRLAPEHPFPIPLNDCYTALNWVHRNGQPFGMDPNRIAVGGGSAGGGLAACLVQLAHDRGEIQPIFQLLVYPMLDDHSAIRIDVPNRELMTWTQASNRFGWESYLRQPCGLDSVPPYSVGARREDFQGFPPAWIGVGSLDLFYEEDEAYAHKLIACGIECKWVVIPGAFHGFDVMNADLPVVQDFRSSQIEALKKYLFPEPQG
jgi:acetyl esterase/lipase